MATNKELEARIARLEAAVSLADPTAAAMLLTKSDEAPDEPAEDDPEASDQDA